MKKPTSVAVVLALGAAAVLTAGASLPHRTAAPPQNLAQLQAGYQSLTAQCRSLQVQVQSLQAQVNMLRLHSAAGVGIVPPSILPPNSPSAPYPPPIVEVNKK